jgi:hypothetical protein
MQSSSNPAIAESLLALATRALAESTRPRAH